MAMWVWIQIILAATAGVGGTIGATAPTGKRLGTFITEVRNLAPVGTSNEHISGEWGVLKVDAGDIHVATGQHWIQFRATKKQSSEVGSPIQGWNWGLGCGCDELQDSLSAYEDIVARLRSGKDAPIFATATAKDSPKWRAWRNALSKYWRIWRLKYTDTPFVHDSHWEMMMAECSVREWKRRGLALDVGPERATYPSFDRDKNSSTLPLDAEDVTASVLSRFGNNCRILVGHDPGNACHVSVLLKAYRIPGEARFKWWIVDEVTTPRSTTEVHIAALRKKLHELKCDPAQDYGQPVCMLDPTTKKGIYTLFRKAKLLVRPADYKLGTNKAATIPKDSRIEMINSLCCNVPGERRLMVLNDNNNSPIASKTVDSIELGERDAAYEAERDKKGDHDNTHWSVAVGYALWTFERPRMVEVS